MEQELFSIEQEKQFKEKNKAPMNDPIRHSRQVVFQLRKKASQVLVELEEDRALLERIQKASEQASLMDDIQKALYLRVEGLLQNISEQVVKEKRVANHNANIFWYSTSHNLWNWFLKIFFFSEDAMNELKTCEQRWLKQKTDRKKQLTEILLKWQTHARGRREKINQEKSQLETECQALIELTKMQREAGKAMADLKDSLVQQIAMPLVKLWFLF